MQKPAKNPNESDRLIDKLASFRFVQAIGDCSYSIYLFHFVLITLIFYSDVYLIDRIFKHFPFLSTHLLLVEVFIAVFVGYVSYLTIEKYGKIFLTGPSAEKIAEKKAEREKRKELKKQAKNSTENNSK